MIIGWTAGVSVAGQPMVVGAHRGGVTVAAPEMIFATAAAPRPLARRPAPPRLRPPLIYEYVGHATLELSGSAETVFRSWRRRLQDDEDELVALGLL